MVSKKDLQERYNKLDTGNLLEITARRKDYTKLGVSVALDELKKRNVSDVEIKNYVSVFSDKPDDLTLQNYRVDLNLLQKIIFYIIWIPKLRSIFKWDYDTDGYVLKSQQADYYSILGFICFVISFASSQYHHSTLIIWGAGFVVCYAYDICFNKEKQIADMNEKIENGKDLWGV